MFKVIQSRIFQRLVPVLHQSYQASLKTSAVLPAISRYKEPDSPNLVPADDPDTFGTLSVQVKEGERDEDDLKEEEYVQNPPSRSQQLGIRQYADMMKDHFKNGRVFEALDVLETRMIKEDRVKPTNYIYNIAIDGCARVGYAKKAFSLYNRMKERQLTVTGATYTSLFNACALSPFRSEALQKARHLREIILEKGYVPNHSNYHAMIKAFGRLGDLETAFQIVDEMQTQKLSVRVETFNFLLQACATDKELGFRHALIVWQKMNKRRMTPDIFSFNLMLRIVRDCGIGSPEETEELLKHLVADAEPRRAAIEAKSAETSKQPPILDIGETPSEVPSQLPSPYTPPPGAPNLLSVVPQLGSLVAVSEVTKPEDRLLLLGGLSGFFGQMDVCEVKPDVKTCTQCLEVMPNSSTSENLLLRLMKERNVKADIDFFNILIKRRSFRGDFEGGKKVLKMIKSATLEPNIMTYGVLALGCRSYKEATKLLEEMTERGIRPNVHILGAMFKQATHSVNLEYAMEVLHLIADLKLPPEEVLIRNVFSFRAHLNHLLKNLRYDSEEEKRFCQQVKKCKAELLEWMDNAGIRGLPLEEAVRKFQVHPYRQFKEPSEDGFERSKNTQKRHWKKRSGKIFKVEE